MEPIVVELAEFYIAGRTVRTNNQAEMNPASAKIAGLWQRFEPTQEPVYGVYSNYQSDATGDFDVTAGVRAEAGLKIQAGKYLVFKARGPMPATVIEAWAGIWAYFAQSDTKRCFQTDFESYQPDGVDIYIGCR